MPWVRIDDAYLEHPKLLAAGPLGHALWLAGLAYCNRNLTDGFIPWSKARTLLDWSFLRSQPDGKVRVWNVGAATGMHGEDITNEWVIEILVDVGLWSAVDGGYTVHDYLDYQPSKEQVLAEREGSRARMAKSRGLRRNTPVSSPVSSPAPVPVRGLRRNTPVSSPVSSPAPVPVPVPVPNSSKGSPSTQEQSAPARVNGMTHVGAVLPALREQPTAETTLLTKAQLDAWANFGPEWDAFKRAWFRKGLHFPPQGTPHDDDETIPSPRAMLYGILDARPTDLPRWVDEAPGRTQRAVIDYVLEQWHAIRDGAPPR